MQSNLSRRKFIGLGATALATSIASQPNQARETSPSKSRRNIIFILIDDMRYDALSILGHPFLETPHLDSLANGGILFENAFVTTSLCSPSRASILTGLYAHQHGILDNKTILPVTTPKFPQILQANGYYTAFIGKWHMGGDSDQPQIGFNHWISFKGQGVYESPTININGEQASCPGEYITDYLTHHAVDFIKTQPANQPFFLYLSHKAVHSEFIPAERHKDCYAGKKVTPPATFGNSDQTYTGKPAWVQAQRHSYHGVDGMYNGSMDYETLVRRYMETMRAVDDSVGQILKVLREKGLLESTMIIFTSDNGFLLGEQGLIDKRCMYEPSIRVPLIAHCPELIPTGKRSRELIINLDHAPTILETAGCPIPETMEGQSYLPLVCGMKKDWRDCFLYEYHWEEAFPQTPTVLGIRTKQYKLMTYHGIWDRYELYDLVNDPDETNNLLGDYLQKNEAGSLANHIMQSAPPEIRGLFDELNMKLKKMRKETGPVKRPM